MANNAAWVKIVKKRVLEVIKKDSLTQNEETRLEGLILKEYYYLIGYFMALVTIFSKINFEIILRDPILIFLSGPALIFLLIFLICLPYEAISQKVAGKLLTSSQISQN